jgi:hypothetical protein
MSRQEPTIHRVSAQPLTQSATIARRANCRMTPPHHPSASSAALVSRYRQVPLPPTSVPLSLKSRPSAPSSMSASSSDTSSGKMSRPRGTRGRFVSRVEEAHGFSPANPRSCAVCGITRTSQWRSAADGRSLCNAHGIQYQRAEKTKSAVARRHLDQYRYMQSVYPNTDDSHLLVLPSHRMSQPRHHQSHQSLAHGNSFPARVNNRSTKSSRGALPVAKPATQFKPAHLTKLSRYPSPTVPVVPAVSVAVSKRAPTKVQARQLQVPVSSTLTGVAHGCTPMYKRMGLPPVSLGDRFTAISPENSRAGNISGGEQGKCSLRHLLN